MTMRVEKAGCLVHPGPSEGASAQYAYHRPRSWSELSALLDAEPDARIVAGATDVMVRIRQRTLRPKALISLRGVPELRGIETTARGLRIGAATPIAELLSSVEVKRGAPLLVQALQRLGSQQIRNVATVGGNLGNASPCADSAPALLAMDATLCLRRGNAEREVSIASFFTGPGKTCLQPVELISAVLLQPNPDARSVFLKKSRVFMDLAQASVAVSLHANGNTCQNIRVAAAAVAPTPLRLLDVEQCLEGQTITPALLDRARDLASQSVAPISDVRATEAYRRTIVGVFVKRAIEQLFATEGRRS